YQLRHRIRLLKQSVVTTDDFLGLQHNSTFLDLRLAAVSPT
ncbi:MAG: hypothetical protein ACI9TZ_002994, partial [Yoonia sp.]